MTAGIFNTFNDAATGYLIQGKPVEDRPDILTT
jgi:hypothetical protein